MTFLAIGKNASALSVDEVRFGGNGNQMRMVMEINAPSEFRVFVLSNPYRMIIDLPRFDWRAQSIQKPAVSGIRDVRQGPLQDDISRIVFDLDTPILIKAAYLLPSEGGKKDRLVVDFSKTTAKTFENSKDAVFGTLKLKNKDAQDMQQILARIVKEPEPEKAPKFILSSTAPTPLSKPALAPVQTNNAYKPLIVIDPGHGGVDPGAVGAENQKEKNVTLALGLALKEALIASGQYRVEMTRETDVFIPLRDRVKFAREKQADLFVSLHADSIHKADVRGSSVYTLSQEASDAQTAKLAEKENKADLIAGIDLSVEDEQVAFILGDFLMTDNMNQSKFFANTLVSKMEDKGVKTLDNTHRYAGFAVLKAPDVPSVLVEAGFMSNKKEAQMLSQKHHRQKLADALKAGIDTYFDHVRQADASN